MKDFLTHTLIIVKYSLRTEASPAYFFQVGSLVSKRGSLTTKGGKILPGDY